MSAETLLPVRREANDETTQHNSTYGMLYMTEHMVIDLGLKAVWVACLVSAPALLSILITGLIVSILQAATQINEQTLSFIPKIIVMTIALAISGPWILATFMNFTVSIFDRIPNVIH